MEFVLQLAAPVHRKFRRQKVDLFNNRLQGEDRGSLLDVGGAFNAINEFTAVYRTFRDVTVVNLDSAHQDKPRESNVRFQLADGCDLPFADNAFDWVMSNAVIEHVGDWQRQQQFAREIRRVARKGYLVATPNYWFPFDPHTLFPCFQYLPRSVQKRMISYAPGHACTWEQWADVRLLTRQEMRSAFPDARVVILGVGNNLVVIK